MEVLSPGNPAGKIISICRLCEAEHVAASQCGQDIMYLREMLSNFADPQSAYEDNMARITMSEHPVRYERSRHIDIL